jgi:hypothetical protein
MSQFDNPNPYASSGYAPTGVPQHGPHLPPSGLAIASLVVGILSILGGIFGGLTSVCCCGGLVSGPVALLVGATALALGYFGMKECQAGNKSGYGMALAGMITGGIGALMGLITFLIFAGFVAFAAANQQPQNF